MTRARLIADVRRFAASSLDDLFAAYAGRGPALVGAGIVVGSQVDPSTIANDHIRAHAEEGRLFRTVVSDAAARAGISVVVHVEKTLLQEAAHALERSTDRLKIDVIELGRGHEGPWRADEKHAALAAWLALPRSRE